MDEPMIERRTWEEFRAAQLLWWVNRILHLFGWAIVVQVEADGTVSDAYPARCKFRGFDTKNESEGFIGLSEYIKEHASELATEAKE